MKLTENQIADELRAMRPLPEAASAAALDEGAIEGFGRRGAAATLLVVGGVAVSQISQEAPDLTHSGGVKDVATSTDRQTVEPTSGAAGAAEAVPPASARSVARSASMTLSTPPDEVAEVAALEKQLAADPSNEALRAALAAERGRLAHLEARVQLTPVSVAIRGDRSDDSGWTLGDAADDAGSVLKAIAGGALVTLAVLVPLALLCALIWLASRAWRRHARERALD